MDFRIESNERERLEESITRQLSTLYKTRRGSIPMHRDFCRAYSDFSESFYCRGCNADGKVCAGSSRGLYRVHRPWGRWNTSYCSCEKEVEWEFLTAIQKLILSRV